jgi:hypothetical protein
VSGREAPAGERLLGCVRRIMDAGRRMGRHINLIARQRLDGQPLRLLAPPGFNPTAVHALVLEAVAWTAALRERLLAVMPPPRFVGGSGKGERSAKGRGVAYYLPKAVPNPMPEDEGHNWHELAKPIRVDAGGIAAASGLMAGLSGEAAVEDICGKLQGASAELGAAADVGLLGALEDQARALLPLAAAEAEARAAAREAAAACPQAEAEVEAEAEARVAGDGGAARIWAAGLPSGVASDAARASAHRDPPPRYPDG